MVLLLKARACPWANRLPRVEIQWQHSNELLLKVQRGLQGCTCIAFASELMWAGDHKKKHWEALRSRS